MSDTRPIPCPDCNRRFSDRNGLVQHARWRHGIKPPKRATEEESMADIAVAAHLKSLSGERLTELEESLLP
jgi:hypothetical protein